MRSARGERTIRFGNYESRKRGVRRVDLRDPYRLAVRLSWRDFAAAFLAAEFLLNLVFALLYLARPGTISNAHPGSLADAFFFSIETLATVGYGEMYPADFYGHCVSAAEIVTGTAFLAVVTGLIFVRVSRPKPCFRYAGAMVVARHHGQPTLMVRVASDQLGILYDAQARLTVLLPGAGARDVVDLPLLRPGIPVFALSWTLMHVLDPASPLAGFDQAAMTTAGLRFFLTLQAEDPALATTVRDLRAYEPAQIRFGMRYADALSIGTGGVPTLDLDRLGLLEADILADGGAAPPATAPAAARSADR